MLCLNIVRGILSPRCSHEERRRAFRRLASLEPKGPVPDDADDLRRKTISLFTDLGLPAAMPAFWQRIEWLLKVPTSLQRTARLDPVAILLGPPPWMKAAQRHVSNPTVRNRLDREAGREIMPRSDEETLLCLELDRALLESDLKSELELLASLEKEKDPRRRAHARTSAATIAEIRKKLSGVEDEIELLEMTPGRHQHVIWERQRAREEAARAERDGDPVVEVADAAC